MPNSAPHGPPPQDAMLALADGRVFRGVGFGARATVTGEVVFNTALSGYQEIVTDPSYEGQLVCLTCSEIGNVGVNAEDEESTGGFGAQALLVRSLSPVVSNHRADSTLHDYLERRGVPGMSEFDTRALTRHVREAGAVMAVLSTEHNDAEKLVAMARDAAPMEGQGLGARVTTKERYEWTEPTWGNKNPPAVDLHVVAYDFGIKLNILRNLRDQGCRVSVVPAATSAKDVLAMKPDGVFLSNGPGDPSALPDAVAQVRELLDAAPQLPVFGICLGHQILCLALGGETYKLKFGHHGANHPVRSDERDAVEISSQNHGFAVRAESFGARGVVTHTNLFDDTVAGLAMKDRPVFGVQYHPEASPGPHDSVYLFERFANLMRRATR